MTDEEWEALWRLIYREIQQFASRDGRDFDSCAVNASDAVMDIIENFIQAGRFVD